jgi:hypothetical protein
LQGASEETCRLSFEHCFHLGDDLRRLAHHLSRKRLKLRAAYSIGFPAALFHRDQKVWIFHRLHKTLTENLDTIGGDVWAANQGPAKGTGREKHRGEAFAGVGRFILDGGRTPGPDQLSCSNSGFLF